MYEAIQKLDEKFELLQARVTHLQEDQVHTEEDQSEVKPRAAHVHAEATGSSILANAVFNLVYVCSALWVIP